MNALAGLTNEPRRFRLRVEDFILLEERGAFENISKAELIDGEIIVLNAQYVRHGSTKVRLLVELVRRLEALGSNLEVYSEVSLRVAPDSMPEPDLFVAPRQGYGSVPVEGVALVVEVSDSTLSIDLHGKAALYAAAGIPEYWVMDVKGQRVVTHRQPSVNGYTERGEVLSRETVVSTAIEGLKVENPVS